MILYLLWRHKVQKKTGDWLWNSCFFLFLGKVHGSLARAGKVKAQTPKVKRYFILILIEFCLKVRYLQIKEHQFYILHILNIFLL